MKKIIYILLFLGLAALSNCSRDRVHLTDEEKKWLDEHKNSIVISCDPGWPPFEYTDKGKHTGFSSEYIKLIEKKTGIKFIFRPAESWEQVMTDFREKKTDLVPSIGEESTRKEYMIFTRPYYSVSTGIIVNTEEKRNLTLNDLTGKRIGVTAGYDTIITHLSNFYPGIKIQPVPDTLAGLRAVSAGILFGMIESPGVSLYYIKKESISNIRIAGDCERDWILRMGVRSDYPLLRDILNKAIAEIPETERDRMLNRWIKGHDNRLSVAAKQVSGLFGCIIIISLLIITLYKTRSILFRLIKRIHEWRLISVYVIFFSLAIASIYLLIYYIEKQEFQSSFSESEKKWLETVTEISFSPNPAAPPLSYIDSEGQFHGLTMDYIKEIEKYTGIKFKLIQSRTFANLLDKIKSGEIDIAGPLQKTAERERYLFFSKPYINTEIVIITRANAPDYNTLDKLKGKKIAVTKGYTIQKYIEQEYPYLSIVSVPNDYNGLLKVSFGEIDAIIADIIAAGYIINKEGISNLKIAGKCDFSYNLCFAVNRNKPALANIINKAMASIDDSKKKEIREKWLGPKNDYIFLSSHFWIILGSIISILSLLIIIIVAWNISLKRKVRERTLELENALAEVKTLRGFLPICANCKKIRNDKGYWTQIEEYIASRTEAQFSHSLCPDCVKKLYPELHLKESEKKGPSNRHDSK